MRRFDTRMWGRWTLTFIGFPLAGLAAKGVAGPIDSATAAIAGGLAAGVVLGAVQSLALRASAASRIAWAVSTGVGLAVGLAVGGSVVGLDTDSASLVLMGALTGVGVGVAQAFVLPDTGRRRALWAATSCALWALGWLITSQVIKDPEAHYATFGASGALVCAALGGCVLAFTTDPARSTAIDPSTRVVA